MKKHLGVNGPFEISLKRAKNFGYNLYYNHCFTTTVEELEKLASAATASDPIQVGTPAQYRKWFAKRKGKIVE